ERELLRVDAAAIVDNADQGQAAARGRQFDAAGTGVERVLDKFLHYAGGTLDDFARRDLVDDVLGKLPDCHNASIGGFAPQAKRVQGFPPCRAGEKPECGLLRGLDHRVEVEAATARAAIGENRAWKTVEER